VLVLKEGTEVREVAVPPLALTADGRALTEAPAENGSAATSPRELALALALQVCSACVVKSESIAIVPEVVVICPFWELLDSTCTTLDIGLTQVPLSFAGWPASAATAAGPQRWPCRAWAQGLLHVAHRELLGVQGDHGDAQDLQQVWQDIVRIEGLVMLLCTVLRTTR